MDSIVSYNTHYAAVTLPYSNTELRWVLGPDGQDC